MLTFMVILLVVLDRQEYRKRMRRLAVGVIQEAHTIKQNYPEHYAQFYVDAVVALRSHGVGEFVAYMPPV